MLDSKPSHVESLDGDDRESQRALMTAERPLSTKSRVCARCKLWKIGLRWATVALFIFEPLGVHDKVVDVDLRCVIAHVVCDDVPNPGFRTDRKWKNPARF